jgi:MinD-like ATPase involved in chromosome partitioning or flagellar assembly
MWGATRRRQAGLALAREIADLTRAVTLPALSRITGTHRIVVIGAKGGVGKTTAAAALGLALSELRGETVAALDANPDTGTLRRRLSPGAAPAPASILELASGAASSAIPAEWPTLARYCDLVGRLRVFSNESADRALVEAMPGQAFTAALGLVSRAAQIVVCDVGTAVTSSLAVAALDAADSLVIATDLDHADLATTMEIVSALAGQPLTRPGTPDYAAITDGYADLIAGAVLIAAPSRIDTEPAEFALTSTGWGRCASPRDPALSAARIQWGWLLPATKREYLHALAVIAARFPTEPASHTRAARAAIAAGQHTTPPNRTWP